MTYVDSNFPVLKVLFLFSMKMNVIFKKINPNFLFALHIRRAG